MRRRPRRTLDKGATLTELLDLLSQHSGAKPSGTPQGSGSEAGYETAKKNVPRLAISDHIAHVEARRHHGAGRRRANGAAPVARARLPQVRRRYNAPTTFTNTPRWR